jgi:hypothetical protein
MRQSIWGGVAPPLQMLRFAQHDIGLGVLRLGNFGRWFIIDPFKVIQTLRIKEYQDFYFPGEYAPGQGDINHILYIDVRQWLALLIHMSMTW